MTQSVRVMTEEHYAAYQRIHRSEERVGENISWGDTRGALSIAREYLSELAESLKDKLERSNPKDRSKRVGVIALLSTLDPDVVALATLSGALHGISRKSRIVGTAKAIGRNIEGEVWATELINRNPDLYSKVDRWARKSYGRLTERQRAARSIAERGGFNLKHWSDEDQIAVGRWLLEVLLDTLPEVFVEDDTSEHLLITEGAQDLAEEAFEQAVRSHPVMFPSSEPPILWSSLQRGGPVDAAGHYMTRVVRAYHKETTAAVQDAIKSGKMKPTLDALNAIQNTAWKINRQILDVIETCDLRGIVVKGGSRGYGIPPKANIPLPPDNPFATKLEQNQRKLEASRIRQTNRMLVGERLAFKADLTSAQELAEYERFYVPHNLDWRGRVYGLSHFNFQRDDRVRALFLFADGEPIGEDGLRWLKIHTANCGDFGKVSKRPYQERVEWTETNAAMIQAIAERPLVDLRWLEADKPFLFLAACVELSKALQQGPSFVTTLPVSWDGSCSGLQHLCAMTRAPEGSLVNLTPSEAPQDVYQLVADVAYKSMEDDLEDEKLGRFARMALDCDVNRRKVVKRNVMTYSYSSKRFGMAQQHMEDLMEPLTVEVQSGRREEHPFTDNESTQHAVARYLATKIYAAIETVVDRPARAMAFLQKIARALAHEGKVVEWTTPLGLPWQNRYHPITTKQVRLWLHDRSIKMRVANGHEKTVDKERCANGVAPNLVHACDATHLMMVVNAAEAEGIHQHALVHDSFGCLASRAGRYHQIIREQFVRLYMEHDVLAEVLERASCALSEHNRDRLPERVDHGSLNIEEVLNADYAFA